MGWQLGWQLTTGGANSHSFCVADSFGGKGSYRGSVWRFRRTPRESMSLRARFHRMSLHTRPLIAFAVLAVAWASREVPDEHAASRSAALVEMLSHSGLRAEARGRDVARFARTRARFRAHARAVAGARSRACSAMSRTISIWFRRDSRPKARSSARAARST